MTPFSDRYFFPLAAIIVLIASFNLFYNLKNSEIGNWDEARYGITAYDMLHSGDYIRTTVLGVPDYWNLKPPLGYWAIAASYKVFGVSRFSLRFPSALSALLCVVLLLVIARKRYGSLTALLSAAILATTLHFIAKHSGRSGDLDATLTLFYLCFVWMLTLFVDTKKIRFLYLSALLASLTFLLKSFAVAFPLALLSAVLFFRENRQTITWKSAALSLSIFLLPILSWLALRYQADGTRFFSEMLRLDLLLMSHKTLEGHAGHALVYLKFLAFLFFPWCLYLLIIPFYGNRFEVGSKLNKAFLSFHFNGFYKNPVWIFAMVIPFAIISIIIETKTEWYIVPIYPLLALWIAWHLADFLGKIKTSRAQVLAASLTVLVPFLLAEISVWKNISKPNPNPKQVFLNSLPEKATNDFHVIHKMGDDWQQSSLFILYAKKGLLPEKVGSLSEFVKHPSDHLLLLEKKQFESARSDWPLVSVFENDRWVVAKKDDQRIVRY